ncbi:MAG: dicarboxylate/amino acid:cation symporter [Bacteroidales bacterium]|nr:dicarboxylate/amino acid:cation symporter [Bacteroidales bacterium]
MKKIKLPLVVKVLIAIMLGIVFGQFVPEWAVRLGNTLSGVFGQVLRFFIPLIIIGLVTPAIADFGSKAGKMLLITVALAYLFTIGSGLFAYLFSTGLFPHLLSQGSLAALDADGKEFAPFFTIAIPPIADVMTALVLSFLLGIGIAVTGASRMHGWFEELKGIVVLGIEKVIIPFLPPYIFCLFLDMAAAGKVGPVLGSFLAVVGIIFGMTLVLLVLQFCIAGIVARRNPFKALWGMLPAYMTALGTASSAATIPVTLRSTVANGVREEIAGFTVPLCATIHMSGSTLKITSCAIALMLMFDMPVDFWTLLGFVMMLGITMVAAPGVPGGSIMAALGILGSILGFDASQQALMITLYIAMDSFGTACNVTGDGAIALIVDRIAGPGRSSVSAK